MTNISIVTKMSIALVLVALPLDVAYAGPPFATDDPEPTDYGHFEIYLSNISSVGRNAADGDGVVTRWSRTPRAEGASP
ncbi:MAG: hypothetical protein ABSA49_09245 [Rhizomicrobium sp.]